MRDDAPNKRRTTDAERRSERCWCNVNGERCRLPAGHVGRCQSAAPPTQVRNK